jgi:hypothetical protein
MGIGRSPERGGAAAEDLAGGEQMGVDFQPDDGFVLQFLPPEFIEGYLNRESLSRQGFQGFAGENPDISGCLMTCRSL